MKRRVPLRKVAQAFAEVLLGVLGTKRAPAFAVCARYLERQRLLYQAPRILQLLDEELLARRGRRRAAVASAVPLGPSGVRALEETLAVRVGAPVTARVTAQPSLLAGFRADVGDLFFDASLQGALSRFRARLRRG